MKVFFLPSYPERAPSTRMRVYKPAKILQADGHSVEVIPHTLSIADKHKKLQNIDTTDILYVQKWRTEFNAAKHLKQYSGKCKIVFDMDDHTGDPQALELIDLADALVVGNHFLYDLYRDHKIFLVPSPVDQTEYPVPNLNPSNSICVAKCGLHSTLKRLGALEPILVKLHELYRYELILAGFEKQEDIDWARRKFSFTRCHCLGLTTYDNYLRTVVPVLQKATVGLLPFTVRDQGKSGHSLLANLAMGIPTCAAPYAECDHIIRDGENGFLANSEQEWFEKVKALFDNIELRNRFRTVGLNDIATKYDVSVVARQLWKCLEEV